MAFNKRLLESFVAVADNGSVGRAATLLNATQPTVSRQLRSLEDQLGQPLFDRQLQGMALTAAGLELLPRARLLLHEMARAVEALDALSGLKRGAVRVGATAAVTRSHLPLILADLLRVAPELCVEVTEASEDLLEQALVRRDVDVIFLSRPPGEIDAVRIATAHFEDRCVPFCASDHALFESTAPSLPALLDERWAMPHVGATPRLHFEAMIRALGFRPPQIGLVTDSTDAILNLVARSSILGWLPLPMLRSAIDAGRIRLLNFPELEWRRQFHAYRRGSGTFPRAAHALVEAMSRHAPGSARRSR